jgi:putative ABC transport system permease protein
MLQDLRLAARVLTRTPGFTTVVVLVVALGTGPTATIFSFANAALVKPLPGLDDPNRLVTIGCTYKGEGFDYCSYPNYADLANQNTVFGGVAAEHRLPVSVSEGGRADRVNGAVVTPNYFDTLGVRMARGRGFSADEDVNGRARPVVVISYGLWSRRFGRDAGLIGRTLSIDATPMTVVGVTTPDFIGTSRSTAADIWVPVGAARAVLPSWIDLDEHLRHRGWPWLALYARLKPDAQPAQVSAQLATIAGRVRSTDPEFARDVFGWRSIPGVGLSPDEASDVRRMTIVLFGMVTLLLLLACSNVSSMLLARSAARAREMTVRSALGASRTRLVRQLLTESGVLAIAGGAAGLIVAFWAAAALNDLLSTSARFSLALTISPDVRVLAFTFGISSLAGLLLGIAPALYGSRVSLVAGLKAAAAAAPRRSPLRPALVVVQLALSLVLLVGAGLLLRTTWNFARLAIGFDTRDLALLTIEPSLTHRYTDVQLHNLYGQLLGRLQAVPGFEAVTLARVPPASAHGWGVNARFPDKPNDPNRGLPYNTVAPNYFSMLGIRIVQGRGFSSHDDWTSPRVMVINETLARTVWPGENPIGKAVIVADETVPREVVGVVPDLKYRSLLEKPRPFAYFSISQPCPLWDAPAVIHARSRLSLPETAAAVRRVVHEIDPDLPVFDVKSMSDQLADSYWRQRITGLLLTMFAIVAAALATAGVYGVMSYVVAERRRELGIRLALGARRADIRRMILMQGGAVIVAGAAIGAVAALAAGRVLVSLLYGVGPRDPFVFAAALAVVVLSGACATYVPARRAAAGDPLVILRDE